MSGIGSRLPSRAPRPPRTPALRQAIETECGAVALAIVLAHHGAWVPFPVLRRQCQVTQSGVNAMGLVQAARHYGLTVRAMRLRAEDLRHVQAPVILFWEHQHFVVLEGIEGDTAWVNDPARGHRQLSLDSFRSAYSGVALVAQPGPAFTPRGEPRQPFRHPAGMLSAGRWQLVLLSGSSMLEALLLPLAILLAGAALQDRFEGASSSLNPLLLAMIALLASRAAQPFLAEAARGAISRRILHRTVTDLAGAPPSFIRSRGAAALAERLPLAGYPATAATRLATDGVRFVVGVPLLIFLLARIQPVAAVVALATLAVPFLVPQLTGPAAARHRGDPHATVSPQAPLAQAHRAARPGSPGALPSSAPRHTPWSQRLARWWPILRPVMAVAPVIVVAALALPDAYPLRTITVVVLASAYAYHFTAAAATTVDSLYTLPEALVQLLDRAEDEPIVERAA